MDDLDIVDFSEEELTEIILQEQRLHPELCSCVFCRQSLEEQEKWMWDAYRSVTTPAAARYWFVVWHLTVQKIFHRI